MFQTTLIAATTCVCLSASAAAADYLEIGVNALLIQLPLVFGYAVVVQGPLESWGEFAALDSETGRELMVDLRSLSPEVHAEIDRVCTNAKPCLAKIEGTIIHIRGTGISELGLGAASVEVQ